MSKPHTLFALRTVLEIDGREKFKVYLKREGYTDPEIETIKEVMSKEPKKIDYKKVY